METLITGAAAAAHFAGAFAAATAGLGALVVAGAWLVVRNPPCNPYGVGGRRCCDACAD